MMVTIYVSSGVGQATWEDECGVEHEDFIGEISDSWLENEAEKHFGSMLGEEIQIEVINDELKQFTIDYVDVFEDGMSSTVIMAEDSDDAIARFEDQSDGCAVVVIVKDTSQ